MYVSDVERNPEICSLHTDPPDLSGNAEVFNGNNDIIFSVFFMTALYSL